MQPDRRQVGNAELLVRLEQTEETIRAIQQGAVDAFVLQEMSSYRVHTLEGSDRPYRIFVEGMQQGVATLHPDGTILYCNQRLPELLKLPHEKVTGASLREFIVPADLPVYENLLWQGQTRSGRGELRLRRARCVDQNNPFVERRFIDSDGCPLVPTPHAEGLIEECLEIRLREVS